MHVSRGQAFSRFQSPLSTAAATIAISRAMAPSTPRPAGVSAGSPSGREAQRELRPGGGLSERLDALLVGREAVVSHEHGAQALAHVVHARQVGASHALA